MLVPTEDGGSGWDRWTWGEHLQQKQPKQLFLWCFRCDSQLWKRLIPFFPHPPWKEAIFFSLWCWVTQRLIQEIIEINLFLIFSLFSPQGAIISSDCNCSSFLSAGRLSEMTSVHSLHEKAAFLHRQRYDCRLVNESWLLFLLLETQSDSCHCCLLLWLLLLLLYLVTLTQTSFIWDCSETTELLDQQMNRFIFLAVSISVFCYSYLFWPHWSHLCCKKSGPIHWIQRRWTDDELNLKDEKKEGTDWSTWVW